MKTACPKSWPHNHYPDAWMAFREASHENAIIANWITSQKAWPKKARLRLTDIGCGDGKVITAVIERTIASRNSVSSVFLIEPFEPCLDGAAQDIKQVASNAIIEQFPGDLRDALTQCQEKVFAADAILCVHVVYLMDQGEFLALLDNLPNGVPLYVAFDDPASVFSLLWKETAQTYLERVIDAHNQIALLPKDKYIVTAKNLVSEFHSSLIAPRNPQSHLLVSMLCYNDSVDLSPASQFGRYFAKVISDNTKEGKVQCRFVGYEIIKK